MTVAAGHLIGHTFTIHPVYAASGRMTHFVHMQRGVTTRGTQRKMDAHGLPRPFEAQEGMHDDPRQQ